MSASGSKPDPRLVARPVRRVQTFGRESAVAGASLHAASLNSHLPMEYSKTANPVMLPPGRARLSTKPARTGSPAVANTIGTLRVAFCNAATGTLQRSG